MPRPKRQAKTRGAVALRAWLASQSVSQEELAEELGVSQATVSTWLGSRVPFTRAAVDLEKRTGIPPGDWLVPVRGLAP